MANWSIKAKYFEACNCAHGCPCNMSGFPTHGDCEGTVAFQVIEGNRDGVDLSGTKVVAAVDWPGAIHEGDGVMAVWIDADADEQREALVSILTAQDGGMPWEILASTISEIHGPFFERIDIDLQETDSRIHVGDKVDIQFETFTNPVTGEPHEAHMVLPSGFIWQDAKICTTSTFRVDADGVAYDHAGNNAYYSEVEWSNADVAAEAPATKFA